ncbi:arginine N-succinyltransferase [Sphingomonas lacunae]|uniref:Arginine N-succinyltransferase n=1 Tax=Sphingomonas lacunae TaxID=2698828 RepID=A0A6M4B050_9SPHN|nr:arginine N-succinyltransferase [Sphingomonas lacunae]QJQ32691.1 arginine N-succinyltransferase [Sphingomonas lacunae]
MSFRIRPATMADLQPMYEMAKLTGGGFTNLPPDKSALTAKLERTAAAFADPESAEEDRLFVLMLENAATGDIRGTCQIFTRVGVRWPFYSYRLGTISKRSEELNRTFKAETLNLVSDLEGSSEVGGLFLHPHERAGGLGLLLARSRYLFIRAHRHIFADRILAELRGVIDDAGGSPFWDGVAGKFFGMNFQEADQFNALHGNQFIADLMPKHPVYTAMLTEAARSVIGMPHPTGRAAMRMLENEGFNYENYIDIFDGGPTMTARTDQVRSIRDARTDVVVGIAEEGERALVSTGSWQAFRSTFARLVPVEGGVTINPDGADTLGVAVGDSIDWIAG